MIKDIIFILLIITPLFILLILNKYSLKIIENFEQDSLLTKLSKKIGLNVSEDVSEHEKKIKRLMDFNNNIHENEKDNNIQENKKDNNHENEESIVKPNIMINPQDNILKDYNKEIPMINSKKSNQVINHNIEKLDFQINSNKCNFYGNKCPNGKTEFGMFNIIDKSVLNGEKLKCDNEYSKDGESCVYCCKQ
tara:strand:- start:955 stop:1533 length:579 start_codon:yes stop_codon:yes gene_type:complete